MLVLTRKEEESIVIGEGVKIYVVAIKGNTVKIGIDAPKEIAVNRSEVLK